MTELFQTTKQNALGRSWGHTAAEIIAEQANAKETHMGLTSFSGKKSKRADVSIAKNYLTAEELDMVNQ